MNHSYDDKQAVMQIHRLHDASTDSYHPAVECMAPHDTTAIWVASVLYLLLDRYLSCVDESEQGNFLKNVLRVFHYMVRDQKGSAYITTVESDLE